MKKLLLTAGLGLMAMAAPAAADAKLFPYAAKANYCPSGLQPIVLNGVICCGVPNQSASYSDYMRHPAPAPKRRYYKPRVVEYGSKSPQPYNGSKSPSY